MCHKGLKQIFFNEINSLGPFSKQKIPTFFLLNEALREGTECNA